MTKPKARLVNLDLDLLRAFLAVGEAKSFTHAGARLGRTQSAISLKIQRLEKQIGTELFVRDQRRVVLTAQGEALQLKARNLLRINDEIVGEIVDDTVAGEVRFGAPDDFATVHLPGVLGDYARSHPSVALSVTCDLTLHLLEKIGRGELDLALIKREPLGPDLGVRVWREPLVWVAARVDIVDATERLPLIAAPAPCVYRKRAISALDTQGRAWRIAYTSQSLAGQLAALRAGLGLMALPREMVPADLIELDARTGLPPLPDAEIALIRAGRVLPVAAERLAAFVLAALDREAKSRPLRS